MEVEGPREMVAWRPLIGLMVLTKRVVTCGETRPGENKGTLTQNKVVRLRLTYCDPALEFAFLSLFPLLPPSRQRSNMPKIPAVSPATGSRPPPGFVHTIDGNFVDSHGRTLLLRGVNLSGSSKAPVDEPSYLLDGFWEHAEAGGNSFVHRPLNLDDGSADVHLSRLRGWGFNTLRYPVTWEALEHEGP